MNLAYYWQMGCDAGFPFYENSTDESLAMVQRVHRAAVWLDLVIRIPRCSRRATECCSLFVWPGPTLAAAAVAAANAASDEQPLELNVIGLAVGAVAAYGDDAADLVKGHNLNNMQPSSFLFLVSRFDFTFHTRAQNFLIAPLHCSATRFALFLFFLLFSSLLIISLTAWIFHSLDPTLFGET